MGLLLIVATIIAALFASGIGGKIAGLAGEQIDKVSKGDTQGPTGQ